MRSADPVADARQGQPTGAAAGCSASCVMSRTSGRQVRVGRDTPMWPPTIPRHRRRGDPDVRATRRPWHADRTGTISPRLRASAARARHGMRPSPTRQDPARIAGVPVHRLRVTRSKGQDADDEPNAPASRCPRRPRPDQGPITPRDRDEEPEPASHQPRHQRQQTRADPRAMRQRGRLPSQTTGMPSSTQHAFETCDGQAGDRGVR